MITVALGELKDIIDGLSEIAETKLPVKTAYWVNKISRVVVKEFGTFEDQRIKLINRYAKKDEKGRPLIENDNFVLADAEGFNKDFSELASMEIDLHVNPFSIDQFGDIEISPLSLAKLGRLLADDPVNI